VESAHGTDVSATIGAALTSGLDSINCDSLKGEGFLAAMEAAERYGSVAEDIQQPLLAYASGFSRSPFV